MAVRKKRNKKECEEYGIYKKKNIIKEKMKRERKEGAQKRRMKEGGAEK